MKLIPLLDRARLELPDFRDTGKPSQSAYARWLNQKGIASVGGGRWTSHTVSRLFQVHIGLIDEVEREFENTLNSILRQRRFATADVLLRLSESEEEAQKKRAKDINDAHRLKAILRGDDYTDQTIPPRLIQDPQLSFFKTN